MTDQISGNFHVNINLPESHDLSGDKLRQELQTLPDKQTSASKQNSTESSKDSLSWIENNIYNPVKNVATEAYNAVGTVVNFLPEKIANKQIMAKAEEVNIARSEVCSKEFIAQSVASGLASAIVYGVAGKFASVVMKTLPEWLKIESTVTKIVGAETAASKYAWLTNEKIAPTLGAVAYDGLRDPHAKDGESSTQLRMANMAGSSALFLGLGAGHYLTGSLSKVWGLAGWKLAGLELISRSSFGAGGSVVDNIVSNTASGRTSSKDDMWHTGASGAVMGAVFFPFVGFLENRSGENGLHERGVQLVDRIEKAHLYLNNPDTVEALGDLDEQERRMPNYDPRKSVIDRILRRRDREFVLTQLENYHQNYGFSKRFIEILNSDVDRHLKTDHFRSKQWALRDWLGDSIERLRKSSFTDRQLITLTQICKCEAANLEPGIPIVKLVLERKDWKNILQQLEIYDRHSEFSPEFLKMLRTDIEQGARSQQFNNLRWGLIDALGDRLSSEEIARVQSQGEDFTYMHKDALAKLLRWEAKYEPSQSVISSIFSRKDWSAILQQTYDWREEYVSREIFETLKEEIDRGTDVGNLNIDRLKELTTLKKYALPDELMEQIRNIPTEHLPAFVGFMDLIKSISSTALKDKLIRAAIDPGDPGEIIDRFNQREQRIAVTNLIPFWGKIGKE